MNSVLVIGKKGVFLRFNCGGISGSFTVFLNSFVGPFPLPFPFCDGDELGDLDGASEGDLDGSVEGDELGDELGDLDGSVEGDELGDFDGASEGDKLGDLDGASEGDELGHVDGASDGQSTSKITVLHCACPTCPALSVAVTRTLYSRYLTHLSS